MILVILLIVLPVAGGVATGIYFLHEKLTQIRKSQSSGLTI